MSTKIQLTYATLLVDCRMRRKVYVANNQKVQTAYQYGSQNDQSTVPGTTVFLGILYPSDSCTHHPKIMYFFEPLDSKMNVNI